MFSSILLQLIRHAWVARSSGANPPNGKRGNNRQNEPVIDLAPKLEAYGLASFFLPKLQNLVEECDSPSPPSSSFPGWPFPGSLFP